MIKQSLQSENYIHVAFNDQHTQINMDLKYLHSTRAGREQNIFIL